MCKLCETNPVYQFTNKRKLCKNCFIKWFQKKILYTIRKFRMIKSNDTVYYFNNNCFRDIVLEDVLKMFAGKARIELINLSSLGSQTDNSATDFIMSLRKNSINVKNFYDNLVLAEKSGEADFRARKISERQRAKLKITKIAISSTLDLGAEGIIGEIIKGDEKNLKRFAPVYKKIIKPLYLFLDKEVLLYAKLRNLKFKRIKMKKDKLGLFIDRLEKKHPEIKHAIVNSFLELYN